MFEPETVRAGSHRDGALDELAAHPPPAERSLLVADPALRGAGVVSLPGARGRVSSRHLVPDLAVVDPAVTASLPPGPTVSSGLDALAHAVAMAAGAAAHTPHGETVGAVLPAVVR